MKEMKEMISSKLTDPFFITASILYSLALIGLAFTPGSWWSAMLLGFGVVLLSGLVLVINQQARTTTDSNCLPKSPTMVHADLVWIGYTFGSHYPCPGG